MSEQALEIHLRRHGLEQTATRRQYIERAAARRPRLPGNLKQLGAVGPVVRPIPANSRTAIVQVRVTNGTTTGKHLSYLTQAKGPDKQDATLFGPAAAVRPQFVQAAQQDPHQFRLVLSTPDSHRVDQTRFTQLFMAQVEKDLGRPLDWMAAHHADTDHPHTHIVLRGQDRTGKDLYMERDYMTYGLRARAAQLLTWMLGPQRQQQQFTQSDRLTYDGAVRGLDDPDTRRQQQTPGPVQQPIPLTYTHSERARDQWAWEHATSTVAQARGHADLLAAARLTAQPGTASRQDVPVNRSQPDTGAGLASFVAGLTALHQARQAQQQAQQRGQGMGF